MRAWRPARSPVSTQTWLVLVCPFTGCRLKKEAPLPARLSTSVWQPARLNPAAGSNQRRTPTHPSFLSAMPTCHAAATPPCPVPPGAVRVLINEDTIRARERSAAGQQLSEHISDIITAHHGLAVRRPRSPQASSSGGRVHTREGAALPGGAGGPFVTVRSIPSASGGRLWRTADYSAGAAGGFEAAEGAGELVSGPVRGWRRSGGSPSRTTHSFGSRQGVWAAEDAAAVAQGGVGVGTQRGLAPGGLQQQEASGQGLGDFMIQQLQLQAQQQSGAFAVHGGPSPVVDAEEQQLGRGAAVAAPEDACKRVQQQLFKEAAAGGFRKLLRSMSPKHVFRPSSATSTLGKDSSGGGSPGAPATATRTSGAAAVGELQWPLLVPAAGSVASSPEAVSPSRSGRSFTASAAAKAAEELGSAAARRPLTPPGQFSPLKASIVAHTG